MASLSKIDLNIIAGDMKGATKDGKLSVAMVAHFGDNAVIISPDKVRVETKEGTFEGSMEELKSVCPELAAEVVDFMRMVSLVYCHTT
tara:strand:+ start:49177 stop:49440 length:264 start_codon:yes stop_codon:yes gene_type:complete